MENWTRMTGLMDSLRQVTVIEVAVMVFSFSTFATIGLSLVVTSWIAALEGAVTLVGQLFFASSAAAFLFSIYSGVITDQMNRFVVIKRGQTIRFFGVAALVLGVLGDNATPWLFVYAILFSSGSALNAGALDGIVQHAVEEQQRMRLSIRVSICRQIGILCGTGIGGVLLHHFSAIWPVLIMVILMLVQFAIITKYYTDYQNAPAKAPQHILVAWKQGFSVILKSRNLAFTILTVGLFFSASQMANVLVPNFVNDTLEKGSDVYGLLETAWAVGGGAVLVTAGATLKNFTGNRWELVILVMVGIIMVVFAITKSIPILVVIYAGLGGLFALGRAICDGRILILAPNREIGRIRAATSMLVSLIGMLVYMSPTLIGIDDTIYYYMTGGTLLSVIGIVLLCLSIYFDQASKKVQSKT